MPTQTTGTTDALIRQAVKERESRRSGRARTVAVLVLLALFVLGLVLAFAVYPGHSGDTYSYQDMLHRQRAGHPLALVLGVVAIVIAALAIAPVLYALDPAKLWGTRRPENCPRCHRPNLREKPMTHTETRGRVQTTSYGVVTLCTAGCGFAAVRQG
ncbi:hypothetical protein EDD99_4505 [Streptomyces sp. 846.5]|nr:hypothetical protein [Streptomyces sp. 846.5]TDU05963.1 hypothetical protein EDD99_4505 [Streptomyces sp. 846.5]